MVYYEISYTISYEYGPFSLSGLEEVVFEEGTSIIGSYMFLKCIKLKSLNIPDGITNIGGDAFYGCSSLTQINIPDNVTYIGSETFAYCSSLTQINIPNGITELYRTFKGCITLPSIIIPNSVTQIGQETFYNCKSLQSIIIPQNINYIEQRAFENCSSLQCVQISSNSCTVASSAFNKTKYQGKTDPQEFNEKCEISIYIECKNDSSDYYDPNSDKCVSEAFVDHYVVQDSKKYYYEECPDTHQLFIDGSKECLSQCPQYYEQDNNTCTYNLCLNPINYYLNEYNTTFKECVETCDNVWRYQQITNITIKICLTNEANCDSVGGFTIQAGNQCVDKCMNSQNYKFIKSDSEQCVEKCENNEFVQETDNKCLTSCSKNNDKQLYQYQNDQITNTICTEKSCQQLSTEAIKYYIYEMTDNQIYCTLSCNNSKFNDKPYVFTSDNQDKCIDKCPDGYKSNDKQVCIQEQKQNDGQNDDTGNDGRLKSGQIAGIVVGVIAAVAIIVVLVLYFIKKRKQNTTKVEAKQISPNNIDQTTFNNDDTNQIMQLNQQNNQQILQPVNINIASEQYNQQQQPDQQQTVQYQQQIQQQMQPINTIDQQQVINQQALQQNYDQQTISNINNYQ